MPVSLAIVAGKDEYGNEGGDSDHDNGANEAADDFDGFARHFNSPLNSKLEFRSAGQNMVLRSL